MMCQCQLETLPCLTITGLFYALIWKMMKKFRKDLTLTKYFGQNWAYLLHFLASMLGIWSWMILHIYTPNYAHKSPYDQCIHSIFDFNCRGIWWNGHCGKFFPFFTAGFETTASTLSYCLYELALNRDIQDRLRSEVQQVKNKSGGQTMSYDLLREMTYMDAIVSGK